MKKTSHQHDILIIGSGLAAQVLALSLPRKFKIAIVTKKNLDDTATLYAQGGIAAVLDELDSVSSHLEDTLKAGAGLCNEAMAQFIIQNSADAIKWLIEKGVPFTKEKSKYHLTREGGHSHRRIIHAKDATGKAVLMTLTKHLMSCDNIDIFENHIAIDMVTDAKYNAKICHGAYVLDTQQGQVCSFSARHTIIAAGGAGKVYLYTSNPDTATGDGVAMARRAQCQIANMEFFQFHPTCLYDKNEKTFLISEAMRGEGGILRLPNGYRFMPDHDDRAELAPRDIVARSIDYEIKRWGLDYVHLDMTHHTRSFLIDHFPTIFEHCQRSGIDISKEPIPVVPAAHYSCGGILINRYGQTNIKHLFAIGESACSGLHGANRLASNSLLECIVLAQSCAQFIQSQAQPLLHEIAAWDESRVSNADEEIIIKHNWQELRRFMWNYVGIVRTNKRLERAKNRIMLLEKEIQDYYAHFRVTRDLIELRNLVLIARLIVESAISRKESRGLHSSLNYPGPSEEVQNTVLDPLRQSHQNSII